MPERWLAIRWLQLLPAGIYCNTREMKSRFVSDTYDDWPFPSGSKQDMKGYRDVTDEMVNALVDAEIIQDDCIAWADDKQPNEVYIRALRYVWLDENGEKD
jgi:hypothetical protein